MKLFLSAAEASSDIHGAQLLKALRAESKEGVEAFGLGGARLCEQGLRAVYPAERLLSMGFLEIFSRLPRIIFAYFRLVRAVRQERPDGAVLIDYPDFHFLLARKLKKLGIPVIYFIPPKIWAWRKRRVRFLKRVVSKVLCILPFEEDFYRENQVDACYVGNPLLDELPKNLDSRKIRESLSYSNDDTLITVMPGSRPMELKYHLKPFLDAVDLLAKGARRKIQVAIPASSNAIGKKVVEEKVREWEERVRSEWIQVRIFVDRAHELLKAGDAALIKSGTSTLEAALLGSRHLIAYDASKLTRFIFNQLIRYPRAVGLSNLVYRFNQKKPFVFREFLGVHMTPENLCAELESLLENSKRQKEVDQALDLVQKKIHLPKASPSSVAAREVLKVIQNRSLEVHRVSFLKKMASFLWSSLNGMVRFLVELGMIRPSRLEAKVVSVGNIQAGGSGKTPIVAKIALEGVARGQNVAILTRGYRGQWERSGGVIAPFQEGVSARDSGDEAALLHERVPGAWIGVGGNRIKQYFSIRERSRKPIDLVILDDGFQHFRIAKDVELLALTSARRGQKVFRDFDRAIQKADLVVWTKGVPRKGLFRETHLQGQFEIPPPPQQEEPFWLVSGVADPDHAERLLRESGYFISRSFRFPDHYDYPEETVNRLSEEAKKNRARLALTGKDWVKWKSRRHLQQGESPPFVLEPLFALKTGQEKWNQVLWNE